MIPSEQAREREKWQMGDDWEGGHMRGWKMIKYEMRGYFSVINAEGFWLEWLSVGVREERGSWNYFSQFPSSHSHFDTQKANDRIEQ